MQRAYLPYVLIPSHEVRELLGQKLPAAAGLALKAILKNGRSYEIAHQQIKYGKHLLAVSSRIGSSGDLILELSIGDPRLQGRLILEEDLRRAESSRYRVPRQSRR